MKKKVLCIFSLIFLALVTCTILSAKIEEEMLLEVIGYFKKESYSTFMMPSDMFFSDETGRHLYEVYEGTGWESGLRAREIKLDSGNSFLIDRDYIIVRGASRQPVYGELAALYDNSETAPATYLAVYPDGIPKENKMLFQAEILEQTDHILLLHVENGTQPFTENRAKGGLIQLTSSNWHIYSLDALTQLWENIPLSMVAIVLVLAIAVFGFNTCVLARNLDRNKSLLWGNGILIVCMLGVLFWVLKQIDLPSSLLPSENIFHLTHYQEMIATIYSALEELGSETTRTFSVMREEALRTSQMVLSAGSVLILAGTAAEYLFAWRKKRV